METLSAFLLQHGILYFVLLLILNMPQVVMTNVLQQPLNEGVIYSSILVSRFMLRLREASSTLPRYNTPIPGIVRRW
ncbi:hypothetical protein BC629DRAFT_1593294 [Irpex lacteus]|nr:hypothetical protein BC629DRAFT_1593294 [Irpex lacteus]